MVANRYSWILTQKTGTLILKVGQVLPHAPQPSYFVHCYEQPCDVRRIKEIADRYGLKVIYDAAHAFALEIPKEEAAYKHSMKLKRTPALH